MRPILLASMAAICAGCAAPTPKLASVKAPAAELRLTACELPEVAGPASCGTFTVPEDRSSAASRRLALKVVVLHATSGSRRPDPLFVLAGGPGEAATAMTRFVAAELAGVRADRDIVLMDQRGTGESNPLQCELGTLDARIKALTTLEFPAAVLDACRAELEQRADLRLYTTPIAMADLDALRAALGYQQVNLYGGSYGTRTAFVYMRQYPGRVRSALLRAIAPVDMRAVLPAARHAQRAFAGLVKDCAADPACARTYPGLATQLEEVLARLAAAPVVLSVDDPRDGTQAQVQITRDVFAGALPFLLADPRGSSVLPAIVRAARAGQFEPFVQVVAPLGAGYSAFLSMGMALAVLCAEDAAAIAAPAIPAETAGTFIGDVRVKNQLQACERWPHEDVAADYHTPVRSDVPVLMISGEYDPIDGLDLAQRAAGLLPNARHVVIPSGTHQPQFPGCLRQLAEDFVAAGSAASLDVACVNELRRPPFAGAQ